MPQHWPGLENILLNGFIGLCIPLSSQEPQAPWQGGKPRLYLSMGHRHFQVPPCGSKGQRPPTVGCVGSRPVSPTGVDAALFLPRKTGRLFRSLLPSSFRHRPASFGLTHGGGHGTLSEQVMVPSCQHEWVFQECPVQGISCGVTRGWML